MNNSHEYDITLNDGNKNRTYLSFIVSVSDIGGSGSGWGRCTKRKEKLD